MIKEKPTATLKVMPQTVIELNAIADVTNEKQYEVVDRLAKNGRKAIDHLIKKKRKA